AGSDRNPLVVGGQPTPGAGTVAALDHALLVDLGDHLAVAREQRLGRAHLRAKRQLALQHAVGALFPVFLDAAGNVRAAAAGAIGALVHLAAVGAICSLGRKIPIGGRATAKSERWRVTT